MSKTIGECINTLNELGFTTTQRPHHAIFNGKNTPLVLCTAHSEQQEFSAGEDADSLKVGMGGLLQKVNKELERRQLLPENPPLIVGPGTIRPVDTGKKLLPN